MINSIRFSTFAVLLIAFQVAGVAASVSLSSSTNAATLGQPVTLTATIAPATATGTVTFYNGIFVLGAGPVTSGVARLTTSLLPAGTQSLKARYNGDSGNAASISSTLGVKIRSVFAIGYRRKTGFASAGETLGTGISSVALGDFNGDGKADLVAGTTETKDISVWLGNGDGTFQPAVHYLTSSGVVAVNDFNRDGKADIVATTADGVAMLLGKGDGTFQTAMNTSTGASSYFVAIADFDGDGIPDLALSNYSNRSVGILMGKGDGGFQAPVSFAVPDRPWTVAVEDFNGDGNADLAVHYAAESIATNKTGIAIRLGDGKGGFSEAANFAPFAYPGRLTAGDMDGDSRPDLAVTNESGGGLVAARGNGDGTFQKYVSYRTGFTAGGDVGADAVAICDCDGDGILDLVAGHHESLSNFLDLYPGQGDGTFLISAPVRVAFTTGGFIGFVVPGVIAASDFNGDGRTDIAMAQSGTLSVLVALAGQTITFPAPADFPFGAAPPALDVTASSGLPVTLSSLTTSVCTVTGSILTVLTGGTCVIKAVQGGNTDYGPAVSVIRSFLITGGIPQPTSGIASAGGKGVASVVSVGSYIAIYGNALADTGTPTASALPLPTTLNGAQVSLGGKPMPLLYAANGQINGLVPQGLTPGQSYPLVVTTPGGASEPVTVQVLKLQPRIYTVDASGSGTAIVANALTGQLISSQNPAHATDNLVIYATGLGAVVGQNGEAPPADGAAAPVDVIYLTRAKVTVTIGAITVPALFSGLTPTLAGLYQVNFQMPAGVTFGGLVITATDPETGEKGSSNDVSISIQ